MCVLHVQHQLDPAPDQACRLKYMQIEFTLGPYTNREMDKALNYMEPRDNWWNLQKKHEEEYFNFRMIGNAWST